MVYADSIRQHTGFLTRTFWEYPPNIDYVIALKSASIDCDCPFTDEYSGTPLCDRKKTSMLGRSAGKQDDVTGVRLRPFFKVDGQL